MMLYKKVAKATFLMQISALTELSLAESKCIKNNPLKVFKRNFVCDKIKIY